MLSGLCQVEASASLLTCFGQVIEETRFCWHIAGRHTDTPEITDALDVDRAILDRVEAGDPKAIRAIWRGRMVLAEAFTAPEAFALRDYLTSRYRADIYLRPLPQRLTIGEYGPINEGAKYGRWIIPGREQSEDRAETISQQCGVVWLHLHPGYPLPFPVYGTYHTDSAFGTRDAPREGAIRGELRGSTGPGLDDGVTVPQVQETLRDWLGNWSAASD